MHPKLILLALLPAVHAFAAVDDNLPAPELTEVWSPVPPVLAAPAHGIPSDAIVLFDGTNLDAWETARKGESGDAPWKIEDGAIVVVPKSGDIRTKASFGDIQLHVEFRTPAKVSGKGQGRGNSGIFFMEHYELQVLDSYQNETYPNGQVASVYKQHIPLANPTRPPGEWQTFDVVFIAPRFSADGKLLHPARLTAFHNGVLVQYDVAIKGATTWRGQPSYKPHAAKLPLSLQDHNNPTAFRNIWVREIASPDQK